MLGVALQDSSCLFCTEYRLWPWYFISSNRKSSQLQVKDRRTYQNQHFRVLPNPETCKDSVACTQIEIEVNPERWLIHVYVKLKTRWIGTRMGLIISSISI